MTAPEDAAIDRFVARLSAPLRRMTGRQAAFTIGCFLAALVGACFLGFWLAGGSYLAFWGSSGPLIGLALVAMGCAWNGIDRNPDVISANPMLYSAGVLAMAGIPISAFGGHMRSDNLPGPRPVYESLSVILLGLLYVFSIVAWMVLIAPAQYFLFLVFGAPARLARASRFVLFARNGARRVEMEEGTDSDRPRFPEAEGWWDASMRDRPVTMTSALMTAGLYALDSISNLFAAAPA